MYEIIILSAGRRNSTIRKTFEYETSIEIPDRTETFCQEKDRHILSGFSIGPYLINRLKFKGNQYLFQREGHFKRKDNSKKEKGIPVHHEKALFLLCHIVVLVVKLI